jgi:hypothetical protein
VFYFCTPLTYHGGPPVRVFLVGKISSKCWRHSIVKGLEERLKTLDPGKEGWPMMEGAILGLHDFAGPYFTEIPKGSPKEVKTHRLCLKGIDDADLVYCWWNDMEAYASLFELGYAKARDKFVVIAYPRGFDKSELWFPNCCADVFLEADTPAAGLVTALMEIVKSGRIKHPEVELERVQKNLQRLEAMNGSGEGKTTGGG